jgi:hypothetical protein
LKERLTAIPSTHIYATGETPLRGDRIYAGREDFITVVREVANGGAGLTTAGWPECYFEVRECRLVERGEL